MRQTIVTSVLICIFLFLAHTSCGYFFSSESFASFALRPTANQQSSDATRTHAAFSFVAVTPDFIRAHAHEFIDTEQGEIFAREGYWDEERFLEDHRRSTGTYLAGKWELSEAVVNEKGEVIAYLICISANEDYPFAEGSLFVFRLAVHRDYRGRRLGPVLLHRFAQKALERRILAVALETWEENTVAQAVYERAGFVWTGAHFYSSKNMVLYQYMVLSRTLYDQTAEYYSEVTSAALSVTGDSA